MFRILAFAVALAFAQNCPASAETNLQYKLSEPDAGFAWPDADKDVLQDARIRQTEDDAKENYQRAILAAERARQSADKVPSFLNENKPVRERVSESAVLESVQIGQGVTPQEKILAGVIEYETGTTASGVLTFLNYPELPHWGAVVAIAPPGSNWMTFEGDMTRPTQPEAYPMEGVLTYSNGDRFTGLFYTWGGASGMYEKADSTLQFLGDFRTNGLQVQPQKGVMKSHSGQLLAVVRD